MDDTPSLQGGPSDYLESLKHAGEQAMKEFDSALVAAMGVKPAKGDEVSLFSVALYLQQLFWSPVIDFWRGFLGSTSASGKPQSRGDRRFKDDAWHQSPYYDLLKQSYLATSKHLSEFVDQAHVDDKSKLQLRFYARQFIDAMSPANFPVTNPEVIRAAIQTRSSSLVAGVQNLIEDLQKGRITRVDESAFEVGGNLASFCLAVVALPRRSTCPDYDRGRLGRCRRQVEIEQVALALRRFGWRVRDSDVGRR